MNNDQTNAGRLRRWLETPAEPAAPTEAELEALARGELDGDSAVEVAAGVAADPILARRHAQVKERLEAAAEARLLRIRAAIAERAVAVVPNRLESALCYLRQQGKALAAQIRQVGARMESDAGSGWLGSTVAGAAVLSTRGLGGTPNDGQMNPGILLRDADGRTIEVTAVGGAFALQFNLGPDEVGVVEVIQILLHGEAGEPFRGAALLESGVGAVLGVPSGLIHVQTRSGFESYILLEDVPSRDANRNRG